jgi:phage tail sheath protein FI
MAYNIGLNIVEVDGSASPAIVGAAVSVGAFNIITQRGVPNQPAMVTSFASFVQLFGGQFTGGLGAYLVKGFFDNGGQTAYINRVISSDATTGSLAANVSLLDGSSQNTLQLYAGYRGTKDPGTWGNGLSVQITASSSASSRLRESAPATIQGTALTEPVDMSQLPSLSLIVDGESQTTVIAFQAADFPDPTKATLAQLRDAINRRQSKAVASITSDKRIALTSTCSVARILKTWTSLQVTAANTPLGFALMNQATYGTPVARTANSASVRNAHSFKIGDAIKLTDGTNVGYSKLMTLDQQTGAVTFKPDVTALPSWDPLKVMISNVEFDLGLFQGGTKTANSVESWPSLSMESDVANYALTKLNDPITGSKYVTAVNLSSNSGAGANAPAAGTQALGQGRDGTPLSNDFIGDSASHTGFYAFDSFDVQLVACERTDPSIVVSALAYCAGRGDCMYIGSVPENNDVAAMTAYGQAFQGQKVYGSLYGPWVYVPDPIGAGDNPVKKIPATGHVMGVYARIESTRGIWKAPAGDEANLLGVLNVELRMSDTEHTSLVKNGSVNGIRAVPRAGVIIDASRTLSTDTRWLYVNVRLLFNYVKSSLKQGLRWVRQEPNRDSLWNAIKFNTVVPFLTTLWRQGAFGTGTPQQVFTVICDASNNPPSQVDQGNLTLEVYFYPSRPAETIVIIVGQQPSGASAQEA